jgi:molybdate-binding protein
MRAKLSWVGREVGSGARQCLDQLFESRPAPRLIARDHRQVVDAVQSGWADAGVCVRLVSEEAGLTFMPVQEEMFDMCYPSALDGDRRIKAFVKLVQSATYRRMLGNLPGYDTSETGNVWNEP